MSRARALLLCAVTTACPAGGSTTTPDTTGDTATDTRAEGLPTPRCDRPPVSFDPAASLPHDATMAAVLSLDDDALPAALARLATHAKGGSSRLPVAIAFSLAQWSWQVPLVRAHLEDLGFGGAELHAFVLGGIPAWSLPRGCTLEESLLRLQRDDRFTVKDTGGEVIATAIDPARSAYDVLARGDVVVLCPHGKVRTLLAAWRPPAPGGALETAPPVVAVHALAPAPVRVAVRMTALLEPDAPETHAGAVTLRANADAIDERRHDDTTPSATAPTPPSTTP